MVWTMVRNGLLCSLTVSLGLAVRPGRAAAQGAVSGRVTIEERPGESTSDLGNAIVYLVPKSGSTPRMSASKTQITMNGRAFVPRVRVVTPGSKVEFPNQDPFSHNIFSTAPVATFDLGLYASGKSKGAEFKRAGAVPVYCNIHPRMTAFILVVPTPYYVQAGADGRWTLPGIPAGSYELRVWHDRTTEVVSPLEVSAAGLGSVDVKLDARGFKFTQHMNKFGKEYAKTGKDRY